MVSEQIVIGFTSPFLEYLSTLLELWPWNWMDSIEYVGFTWVILYISFTSFKFAMMDEREMLRYAKLKSVKL